MGSALPLLVLLCLGSVLSSSFLRMDVYTNDGCSGAWQYSVVNLVNETRCLPGFPQSTLLYCYDDGLIAQAICNGTAEIPDETCAYCSGVYNLGESCFGNAFLSTCGPVGDQFLSPDNTTLIVSSYTSPACDFEESAQLITQYYNSSWCSYGTNYTCDPVHGLVSWQCDTGDFSCTQNCVPQAAPSPVTCSQLQGTSIPSFYQLSCGKPYPGSNNNTFTIGTTGLVIYDSVSSGEGGGTTSGKSGGGQNSGNGEGGDGQGEITSATVSTSSSSTSPTFSFDGLFSAAPTLHPLSLPSLLLLLLGLLIFH